MDNNHFKTIFLKEYFNNFKEILKIISKKFNIDYNLLIERYIIEEYR